MGMPWAISSKGPVLGHLQLMGSRLKAAELAQVDVHDDVPRDAVPLRDPPGRLDFDFVALAVAEGEPRTP